MEISAGNAGVDGRDFGGWFVGDLLRWSKTSGSPVDFGCRQSTAVEIKWGVHRRGESRGSWAKCSGKKTLSVLVSGRFRLQFRSPNAAQSLQEQCLEHSGDYAVWGTDVEHTWIVEEDAVVFTVRWRESTP
jgi:hypothetical protein